MSQKSLIHRDNLSILGSEMSIERDRAKSALNIVVSSTASPVAKNSQRTIKAETRPFNSRNTPRMFNFSFTAAKDTVKKTYMKNSEKTIKPPERPLKAFKATPIKPQNLQREQTATLLPRNTTSIKNVPGYFRQGQGTTGIPISTKRSLTYDNLKQQCLPTPRFACVDVKAIDDLARRLEQLQTIFLNKLELYQSREPASCQKAYKLVAVIVGDEAKLLINENDAQSLPSNIPARSVEDLNLKISKFFTGCLIAFTDKLRAYQCDNQPVDCDEIYKELKRDEQTLCGILKDWVLEMCDEADTTLKAEPDAIRDQVRECREFGTQSDFKPLEYYDDMPDKDFVDLVNLRVEINELKLQLTRKDERYLEEIGKLKEEYELKLNDLNKSLQVEKTISTAKDEKINKIQDLNESLSQQLKEANALLDTLGKRNEELNTKFQNETDQTLELKRIREELQNVRQENNDLHELKSNFLKKLNQRATRIDLLEKEIKQLKRKAELQNKEIEDLKLEFDTKVKENRDYKESLDARNHLIIHLRKAVEIEQRKLKEYEEHLMKAATVEKSLPNGHKSNDAPNEQHLYNRKHAEEPRKCNFSETLTVVNFLETMPDNIAEPFPKLQNPKTETNNQPNLFDFNVAKDSTALVRSKKMIAVKENLLKRKF